MVSIALENVSQQSLRERLVSVERTTPSLDEGLSYCRRQANLRICRFRIHCECPLKKLAGRLSGGDRRGSVPSRPSAHHEIPRVGIGLVLTLEASDRRHYELAI